ncbi:MAG: hypothetical protein AB7L36_02515 [Sphingomonadaceae bacterium]
MQSATDKSPRPGPERVICSLVLRSEDGADWRVSLDASLEKCIGRYARIPELACNDHLLTILRHDGGLVA